VESLILLAIMMVLIWAFMILPQQRRQKRHAEMVASIQPGDEVLITAGVYGKVTEVFDDDLFLEVSPGVEIRVASAAVAMRIEFEDDADGARAADGGSPLGVDEDD
jgi:preprotein translocase subunit YajC